MVMLPFAVFELPCQRPSTAEPRAAATAKPTARKIKPADIQPRRIIFHLSLLQIEPVVQAFETAFTRCAARGLDRSLLRAVRGCSRPEERQRPAEAAPLQA